MPPDTPVGSLPFADILETCRQFLLAIANAELPAELRAKGGASDLVQDTLVAAHLAHEQFRGQTLSDLRAWLRGILLNELAMFRRRYQMTGARDISREVPFAAAGSRSTQPTPLQEVLDREDEQALANAVDRLPALAREVVRLRLGHGLSFAAIGRHLGKTEEAARKLFTRSLAQLRARPPAPGEATEPS